MSAIRNRAGKSPQLELDFSYKPTLLELLSVNEIYATADQELLFKLKEDKRIERKTAGIHPESLQKWFAMWANTPPDGGIIALGIEDDGSFTGCLKLSPDRLNAIDLIADKHCPDAKFQTRRIPIRRSTDGVEDYVILIRVFYHPTKLVENVKGEAYIRIGDQCHQLDDEAKHAVRSEKGQVQLELETAANYQYPDDFDMDLVAQFVAKFRKVRNLADERPSDVEILKASHLGTIQGAQFIPNVACVAVFARDPAPLLPGCKVRFLRFEGDEEKTGREYNAVKDEIVEGNIPTVIAAIDRIVADQLRMFSRMGEDGRFYTAPEYPYLAWHEALVNACAHRSYALRNMNVFVKMFDSRLEVVSPGGFPPTVTPHTIYQSQHSRNPFMMGALLMLDYVKCVNEGTRRMRDEMLSMGLPQPQFVQQEVGHSQVRVTLKNNSKQRRQWVDKDVIEILGEQEANKLTEHERRVVNYIAEYGRINVSQAQRLNGNRMWHTEKKLLTRLTDAGILEHVVREGVVRDQDAHYILRRQKKG